MSGATACTLPPVGVTTTLPCSWLNVWANWRPDCAVPLQVLESSPVSGKEVPHWLSRLIDHIESRPRWLAPAKLTRVFASATVKISPWMSFWPIIGVAPSPCQICCALRWMPYCGYRLASCPWVAFSASSANCAIVLPAAGGELKSIVMMLTPAIATWLRSIELITDRALSCSPSGSTGRVSHTLSLGSDRSRLAIASARRFSAAALFSAAPSMSRSIVVSE